MPHSLLHVGGQATSAAIAAGIAVQLALAVHFAAVCRC
jgi:hypothetical protein